MFGRNPFDFRGPFRANRDLDLGGLIIRSGETVDLSAFTDAEVWQMWQAYLIDVETAPPATVPVLRLLAELDAIAAAPLIITGAVVPDVAQAAPGATEPPPAPRAPARRPRAS